jgi:hypothetical protein
MLTTSIKSINFLIVIQNDDKGHQDLLGTYRDDFNKYPSRIDKARLEEVLASIPQQLGKKFVYKHVNPHVQSAQIKNALHLLSCARLCHYTYNNRAEGIPLAAGMDPELYCWTRAETTSQAEVDYIIQHGTHLIPIEVKAGKTGTLKSLHLLMGLRKWDFALRFNTDLPSLTSVHMQTSLQQTAEYQLLSLPLYLIGQSQRLIAEHFATNH